ncbi:SMI1/KNR4 family protein [Kineococcus sp. SYSU DK004]|uniref:hypothetical protein n=1 Tax=Kineococcus sp. SYSU DK004 TaxID=3383125 RepID=UPI003D7D4775
MHSSATSGRRRVVRPSRSTPAPVDPSPAPPALDPVDPVDARVGALLDRLRAQWTRVGADIAGRLRPGVGDAELDAVEERTGLRVPAGARAWWRRVDGVEAVRTRYRSSSPTVGPGGWVPLRLADALERSAGTGVGPGTPPGLLPLFARDEELVAVRLGAAATVVEHLALVETRDGYQHGWRVDLEVLLGTWADSLLAAVVWLPESHDWVVDPFAVQALPLRHLVD